VPIAAGCIIDGGYSTVLQQQYVCYDVVDYYFWNDWQWVPVYTTVCQWASYDLLAGETVDGEYQECREYQRDEKSPAFVRTSGASLADGQIIQLTRFDASVLVIRVSEVSEPISTS
jgi:hypothetical protein